MRNATTGDPTLPYASSDDLLTALFHRVSGATARRGERNRVLAQGHPSIVEAFRAHRVPGPFALDAVPLPDRLRTTSVDGANISDPDTGEAFSLSVAMACSDDGSQLSSACLAGLPHMADMGTVSGGLMMMQEVMLAVGAAEADPSRLVVVDGSRLSTMIAVDQFYVHLRRHYPGQLARWRSHGADDPGTLINLFEGEDWLARYVRLPNVVGNVKLVTSRRLGGIVLDALGDDPVLRDVVGDLDDKTLANVVLRTAADGSPGEGMGPFRSPPPRSPFHVESRGGDGDAYPRAASVEAAIAEVSAAATDASGTDADLTGYAIHYVSPLAAHGAYSLEVNAAFDASPVAAILREGRPGSRSEALTRGLAAFVRAHVPAIDIQEPFLTHVADRRVKEAVRTAREVLVHSTRNGSQGSLSWLLSRPHRT